MFPEVDAAPEPVVVVFAGAETAAAEQAVGDVFVAIVVAEGRAVVVEAASDSITL